MVNSVFAKTFLCLLSNSGEGPSSVPEQIRVGLRTNKKPHLDGGTDGAF
jgi:hypothetical protein